MKIISAFLNILCPRVNNFFFNQIITLCVNFAVVSFRVSINYKVKVIIPWRPYSVIQTYHGAHNNEISQNLLYYLIQSQH